MAHKFDLWQTDREAAQVVEHGIRVLRSEGTSGKHPSVKIWNPKATKPAANYWFKTVEQREAYVSKFVEDFGARQARKAADKAEAAAAVAANLETVGVGQVFVWSWGYDQTNVDYYQVTEKRGQLLTLRAIAQSVVPGSEGFMSERVKPRLGHFLEPRHEGDETGQPFKKRVQFTADGRAYLSMPYGWCQLWRGESEYQSHYA